MHDLRISGDVVADGVGDELLHDVGELGSEQHDATGDLVDPSTSNACSLLYALPLLYVLALSLLVVLSIIGITPKPSLRTRSP